MHTKYRHTITIEFTSKIESCTTKDFKCALEIFLSSLYPDAENIKSDGDCTEIEDDSNE